jgi:hypothetical protein
MQTADPGETRRAQSLPTDPKKGDSGSNMPSVATVFDHPIIERSTANIPLLTSLFGCVGVISLLHFLIALLVVLLDGFSRSKVSYCLVTGLLTVALWTAKSRWRRRYERRTQCARDEQTQLIFQALLRGQNLKDPFFLYLRPFSSTARYLKKEPTFVPLVWRHVDFETNLANAVQPWGYLVALGRPGEHVGFGRVDVTEADWQKSFALLARYADSIFILPYASEGILWELTYLVSSDLAKRTVFLLPPKSTGYKREDWNKAASALKSAGISLPEYSTRGCAFLCTPTREVDRHVPFPTDLGAKSLRRTLRDLL